MGRSSAYRRRPGASTTTFAGEPANDPLESSGVLRVERRAPRRVDVEHGDQVAVAPQYRHDDLRLRPRVAGNVSWKPIDVGHDDRAALGRRRAAHALANGDLETAD